MTDSKFKVGDIVRDKTDQPWERSLVLGIIVEEEPEEYKDKEACKVYKIRMIKSTCAAHIRFWHREEDELEKLA